MYLKAVAAVRKAQAGTPTGHLVGFDAVCSGMQIMSALTGCHKGAHATGLVDPNHRADAYTDCTNLMSQLKSFLAFCNRPGIVALFNINPPNTI